MARTPLLRALRQLAGEHAAAEKLGIPVAELPARREEQAYLKRSRPGSDPRDLATHRWSRRGHSAAVR